MAPPGPPQNAEKALAVREYSEKAVRTEMERITPDVPYTLVDLIGKGSFGCVFKAVHNETRQVVAIKSLDLDQHDDEIKDIQKEITLLSHLAATGAPNITAYHGSYLLGARLWVVMDLCSGGSMRTLMKAGPIEEKFIVVVIREVLTALGWLHNNGIIHRDIKAANILVGQDGKVQLCDFGVSAQSLAGKGAKRTTFVGTPQWMAPEALLGGEYDWRVDIWSFGITIIEIAKQNPPLHHIHPARVVDIIPRQPPPRLEGGTWSEALRSFVATCLTESPSERPSVEELQKTKLMKAAKLPTSVMKELILRYEIWERGGGVRGSIMIPQPGGHQQDTVTEEPGWDFDTVKQRASGVPKEWDMPSKATVKPLPLHPTPWSARPPRAANHLVGLFEDPDNPSAAHRDPPGFPNPVSNVTNVIHIPTLEDNINIRPPSPSPIGMISLEIPSDEDLLAMAAKKAAENQAAASQKPPPTPLTAPNIQSEPPSTTQTRAQRSDSLGISTPRPELNPPVSPQRDPSPRRPPVSAPSSPPHGHLNSNDNNIRSGMNPPHRSHLPSNSVPNFSGPRGAEHSQQSYHTPPIPGIPPLHNVPPVGQRKLHSLTSATSNPNFSNLSAPIHPGPHKSSHSQDVAGRSQPPPPLRPGPLPGPPRPPGNKPPTLNLPLNHSNFNTSPGPGGRGNFLPPSPGRPCPPYLPRQDFGPGIGMGIALGAGGPGMMNLQNPPPEFPALDPLNSMVLMGNGPDLAKEMERILTGLGDALEVMEVGLKRLGSESKVEE
ncbi:kinase-like protein [Ascodesmis nigricans]|uniref:non-specific serine/threonine protein kinase n=1 Tax=Ascodesmis nigricans TaxID=341454 RepID=A0A4S2N6D1_9PEZI|nr:kinase-like protein [Ascodesmis nigricans]